MKDENDLTFKGFIHYFPLTKVGRTIVIVIKLLPIILTLSFRIGMFFIYFAPYVIVNTTNGATVNGDIALYGLIKQFADLNSDSSYLKVFIYLVINLSFAGILLIIGIIHRIFFLVKKDKKANSVFTLNDNFILVEVIILFLMMVDSVLLYTDYAYGTLISSSGSSQALFREGAGLTLPLAFSVIFLFFTLLSLVLRLTLFKGDTCNNQKGV